jgi:hypothetical protein
MNTNIQLVEPAERPTEFFGTFEHALPCAGPGRCERRTTWGLFQHWEGEARWSLTPYCWEHGFAQREYLSDPASTTSYTSEERKEQRESVERFVLLCYDGDGSASVLSAIAIEEVDGWQSGPTGEFSGDDLAWSVQYEHPNGRREYVQVVWSFDEWSFSLFRA